MSISIRREVMERVLERRRALVRRVVARARGEFPGYMAFETRELTPGADVMFAQILTAMRDGRPATADELGHYTEYGRDRARLGVSLPDLLGVWQMAVREVAQEIATVARACGAADRLVLELTTELLEKVDVAVRAYTVGHREVNLATVGHDRRRRSDFVLTVLFGWSSVSEIHKEAAAHGLQLDRRYVAIRSRISSVADREEIDRLVEGSCGADRPALLASLDGDLAGVLPHDWLSPAREVTRLAVGAGPAVSIGELASSFESATRAMETAVAFDLRGVLTLADLGLLVAVTNEPDIGDRLVDRYLAPLSGSNVAGLYETLEHYLDTGLNVEATANRLFLHANTVRYRLARFREITGCDFTSVRETLELWWALQRRKVQWAAR